jgi:hypothetical protein
MNKKLTAFFLLLILSIYACNYFKGNSSNKNQIDKTQIDSLPNYKIVINQNDSPHNYFDSLSNAKIDTTTLVGKRERIINLFLIEHSPSIIDFDTLMDLNYDNKNDFVIGYYGHSGTGIKNKIQVFLFNAKSNSYSENEQLSNIMNPTFYLKQKKITGFYIGNGGGGGQKLEWRNKKWIVTKEFDVDIQGKKALWKINYPLKKKTETIIRSFNGIPKDILETNIR